MTPSQEIRNQMNLLRKDYADGKIRFDEFNLKMKALTEKLGKAEGETKYGVVQDRR